MFDILYHRLACTECGRAPTSSADLDMQVRFAADACVRALRVGDAVVLWGDLQATNGYVQVSEAALGTILEDWACPICAAPQWASILVRDGVISEVAAAGLDERSMERARHVAISALMEIPRSERRALKTAPLQERRHRIAAGERQRRAARARWAVLDFVGAAAAARSVVEIHAFLSTRNVLPPHVRRDDLLDELEATGAIDIAADGSVVTLTPSGRKELA